MKPLAMATVLVLAGLNGCATPASSPSNTSMAASKSTPQDSIRQATVRQPPVQSPSARAAPAALPLQAAEPDEIAAAPDAVIKLDPKTGKLSSAMETRLLKVADEARQDNRIILRLEAYVPDGGSSALSIGVADKALRIVRDRLLALGISARQIVHASFGQEHDKERDLHRHWVEIYVLKKAGVS